MRRGGSASAQPIASPIEMPIASSQPGPAISGSSTGVTAAMPTKIGATVSADCETICLAMWSSLAGSRLARAKKENERLCPVAAMAPRIGSMTRIAMLT